MANFTSFTQLISQAEESKKVDFDGVKGELLVLDAFGRNPKTVRDAYRKFLTDSAVIPANSCPVLKAWRVYGFGVDEEGTGVNEIGRVVKQLAEDNSISQLKSLGFSLVPHGDVASFSRSAGELHWSVADLMTATILLRKLKPRIKDILKLAKTILNPSSCLLNEQAGLSFQKVEALINDLGDTNRNLISCADLSFNLTVSKKLDVGDIPGLTAGFNRGKIIYPREETLFFIHLMQYVFILAVFMSAGNEISAAALAEYSPIGLCVFAKSNSAKVDTSFISRFCWSLYHSDELDSIEHYGNWEASGTPVLANVDSEDDDSDGDDSHFGESLTPESKKPRKRSFAIRGTVPYLGKVYATAIAIRRRTSEQGTEFEFGNLYEVLHALSERTTASGVEIPGPRYVTVPQYANLFKDDPIEFRDLYN